MSDAIDMKRRNTKTCRQCNKQVPPACKTCSCGFIFKKASPSPETTEAAASATEKTVSAAQAPTETSSSPAVEAEAESSASVQHRRTQRTRRERPHFFDSLEYGSNFRKQRKNLTATRWLEQTSGTGKRKGTFKAPSVKSGNTSSGNKNASLSLTSTSSQPASLSGSVSTSSGRASSVVSSKDSAISSLANTSSYASCGNGNGGNGSNDEDIYGELSTERQLHYTIILAELNRKCCSVRCQPG